MQKQSFRKGIAGVLLLMLAFLLPNTVMAAEQANKDGITAVILTEQNEYQSGEEISITVKVTNNNSYDIKDIVVQNILPKNVRVKEGEKTEHRIEILKAGESKEIKVPAIGQNQEENGNENIPSDNTTDREDLQNTNKNNKSDSAVKTGDNVRVLSFFMLITAGFLIIAILLWRKKKGFKSFFAFLLCTVMLQGMLIPALTVKASVQELSVDKKIKIDGVESIIGAIITYKTMGNESGEDSDVITRAEWINRLIDAMDYEEMKFELEQPYFNDTEGTIVENSINYAVAYGVISVENENFLPNQPATREFVAVTTIKALGFIPQEDLECADSAEIRYIQEAKLAVDLGVIHLIDNYFYPLQNANEELVVQALKVVADVLETQNIDNEPSGEIIYRDEVIQVSASEAELGNGTLVLKEDLSEKIKIGDIIVIEDMNSCKVTDVSGGGANKVFSTVQPTMEEVIESMDVEGPLYADYSRFTPAEGVRVELPSMANNTTTLPEVSKSFPFEIPIGEGISIKGNLGMGVTAKCRVNIETNLDWPPFNCKDVLLQVDPRLNVEAGFYAESKEKMSDEAMINTVNDILRKSGKSGGRIELGEIPLAGVPGVNLALKLNIVYDFEGHLKVTCNFSGQEGVQCYQNSWRLIHSAETEFATELAGKAKIGTELQCALQVKIIEGVNLVDFSMETGMKGDGNIIVRPTLTCGDLGAHVYWDISAFNNSKVGEWFEDIKWNESIWNESNSPWKLRGHWENGQKVPECTYKKAIIKGIVVDENGAPIENAVVTAYEKSSNKQNAEVNTDVKGNFSLSIDGGKTYNVETAKEGFVSRTISDIATEKGKEITLDNIVLERQEPEKEDITSAYNKIIQEYSDAIAAYEELGSGHYDELKERFPNVDIDFIAWSRLYYYEVVYGLYDIDENGVEELFIGCGYEDSGYRIADLFAYDGEKAIRLFDKNNISIERAQFRVYLDGTMYHYGSGGAYYGIAEFYKLGSDGCSVNLVNSYEFDAQKYPETPYYNENEFLTKDQFNQKLTALGEEIKIEWKKMRENSTESIIKDIYNRLVEHYKKGTEDSSGEELTVMEGTFFAGEQLYRTAVRCGVPGNPTATQRLYDVSVDVRTGETIQKRVLTDNKIVRFNIYDE